ncbi:MAG: HlyD family efflux transporter periplasmic adaptor subunit [Bacteroidales bacterium]|nr:MAG: HlyD family efflux transporter periplasmic adaptor subunit [Bacteroidales bacterium]
MEIKDKASKINLRSEEITEILGVPPKWILRWGITVIFVVIATIFFGSAFFKYPDIVIAPATITSENPPSVIISKANGKITDIFFTDGQLVSRGDTIAVIENPAKLKDILTLSRIVQKFNPQQKTTDSIVGSKNLDNLNLGDIQNPFNSFSKAYAEHQLFQKQDYHKQKIRAIESEIKQYNQYYNQLCTQRNLTIKDLELTQKQFTRDSQLFKSGVIPALEYERSQATILSKRQALENAKLNLSSTTITIEKLRQNILDTKLEQESQCKKLTEDLVNNFNQLVSTLSAWEKTYLLIAPSSGKLTYMNVWSNLQEVKSGDRLFTINPEKRGKVFAQLTLPFEGAGKVKPEQHVNIKLDGYPYMEFGMVEGTIESISSGSMENGYPAIVSLHNGATTGYGENLSLDRDLTGIAEITTEDMTLLKRLLNPLKHIFKNRVERHK